MSHYEQSQRAIQHLIWSQITSSYPVHPVILSRRYVGLIAIQYTSTSSSTSVLDSEQESEELGDDVMARLNPDTKQIENLEVLFFSTRLLRSNLLELPITADLRLAV